MSNCCLNILFLIDVDECLPELNVCDVNARCYNVPGSFQCQCNSGYRGDGRTCVRKL
jgi:nidogen (entactin)